MTKDNLLFEVRQTLRFKYTDKLVLGIQRFSIPQYFRAISVQGKYDGSIFQGRTRTFRTRTMTGTRTSEDDKLKILMGRPRTRTSRTRTRTGTGTSEDYDFYRTSEDGDVPDEISDGDEDIRERQFSRILGRGRPGRGRPRTSNFKTN